MKSVHLAMLMLLATCTCMSCALAQQQTPLWPSTKDVFQDKIEVGRTLEFRPRRFPTGAPTDHACLRGNYTHRYESTAGFSGREVWLCCVPIEELAREAFQCADESIGRLFEDTLYMKVRFCSLLHPTSTDPTLIPVCVPAPVVAPISR